MNLKLTKSMSVLLISLLFCTAASCQEKQSEEKKTGEVETTNEIKEKDFNEILTNAKKELNGKTYRLTETEEFYGEENAEPEKTEINLLEIVPPDKRRELKEIKSPTKNSRVERIWDGKNLYVKKDDKKWEKLIGGGGAGFDFRSGRTTKVYRFLGITETDGQQAKLYSEEKKRVANKLTRYSSYQVYSYENTKYWFAENGLLLRIETEEGVEKVVTNEGVKTPKSVIKKVSVYEYDPNIKIETPEMNEK